YGKRIEALETLCGQMNTNISSLQSLVSALENNDYVKSIAPVTEGGKTVGYTITFTKSQPVTIYNGKDAEAPAVSLKQDGDGNWYWTLNGEWLLDDKGGKVRANGLDGKDAVAPQLKIENERWMLSTDGGDTWADAGKATGDRGPQGPQGEQGEQGEQGDSFFASVEESATEVTFTLEDEETTFTIKKYIPFKIGTDDGNDAILLEHSKTTMLEIRMPEGLLESDYVGMMAMVKDGSIVTKAGNGWNAQLSKPVFEGGKYKSGAAVMITPLDASPIIVTIEVTLLFADGSTMQTSRIFKHDGHECVDLGLSVKWASWNVGAKSETDYGSYFAWGETEEKEDYTWDTYTLGTYDSSASPDYGMTKYKSTGPTTLEAADDPATVAWGSKWRSPTLDEIKELFDKTKCERHWGTRKDANGVDVNGYTVTSKINGNSIFLPAAGYR
ncbi:MAG: hypothetical protein HUJ95_05445, partial [Bacteroidales bacterium]|nr:hypothetical protein [Bacteroidales bacterium]